MGHVRVVNVYARVYWLCLLGVGLLLAADAVPTSLAGAPSASAVVVAAASVSIVVAGLVGLASGDDLGAPDRPNLLFAVMVLAFVLSLAGSLAGLV